MISTITAISMGGVALGVAALIVVLSVMNGFFDFVRDMLVSLDPHVRIVSTETQGIAQHEDLVTLALRLSHVEYASPYVEGKVLLSHEGDGAMNVVRVVRGVEAESLAGVSTIVERTGFGAFDVARKEGKPGIVMGMSLGQRLALLPAHGSRSASEVALLSAPGIERMLTQVFGVPPVARFEVRGLYQAEAAYEDNYVFIDLPEAQRLFRMGDRVSGIELRLDDLEKADAVKAALQAQLDPAQYEVLTWYDLQRSLYDVMVLEKWGASLILILIVVVAVFNIIGSLTMVVIEKRQDIGVLQAMGVSQKNIRRIFLTEGLLIGGIGTGAGLIVGVGLALLQKYFEIVPLADAESFIINAYPVAIQPLDLVLITSVTLLLCILAALYPAQRAAAIQPARAVTME